MRKIRELVKRIPILAPVARAVYGLIHKRKQKAAFVDSQSYWQERYRSGGNSGAGSYSLLAEFKAEVLNDFVEENAISTVLEFGCGDGNQLLLARYPRYSGYDVSERALEVCREKFADDVTKKFALAGDYDGGGADLVLSLDVIYHLVEDDVFHRYMENLVRATRHYLIVYSSDYESEQQIHVRHRKFTDWLLAHAPELQLVQFIQNRYPYSGDNATGSLADFFIYSSTPVNA